MAKKQKGERRRQTTSVNVKPTTHCPTFLRSSEPLPKDRYPRWGWCMVSCWVPKPRRLKWLGVCSGHSRRNGRLSTHFRLGNRRQRQRVSYSSSPSVMHYSVQVVSSSPSHSTAGWLNKLLHAWLPHLLLNASLQVDRQQGST